MISAALGGPRRGWWWWWCGVGEGGRGRVGGLLTLERSDEHVPVLDELFDEFIRALQLDFMAFDPLSEVRAVQERVAELQRGESHRGGGGGGSCDRDKK